MTLSKYKLACFGKYPWSQITTIPLFMFDKNGFLSKFYYLKNIVAQWAYPHMTGLAYLKSVKYVSNQGADITELWVKPPKSIVDKREEDADQAAASGKPSKLTLNLINEMLSLQQNLGSFGAYTVSTALNMLSLQHFSQKYPDVMASKIKVAITRGFSFIEFNTFNYLQPYQGNCARRRL